MTNRNITKTMYKIKANYFHYDNHRSEYLFEGEIMSLEKAFEVLTETSYENPLGLGCNMNFDFTFSYNGIYYLENNEYQRPEYEVVNAKTGKSNLFIRNKLSEINKELCPS